MQPYFENDTTTLYQGDCLDVMPQLPPNSVDLVLADIPYGTTACSWDSVIPFDAMWKAIKHVAKKNAAVVLFGSQPFTSVLIASNLPEFRYEWIWEKSVGGGFLNANKHPLKRHENVCVFSKNGHLYNPQKTPGKPYKQISGAAGETTIDKTVAGWLTQNNGERHPTSIIRIASETGLHPTQKPVDLMAYFINTYSNAGDTVLDFTCGSGTTLVAAQQCGRRAIGIERDRDGAGNVLGYCDIAVERLAQRVMVLE